MFEVFNVLASWIFSEISAKKLEFLTSNNPMLALALA
jgi:hypothetical protein